METLEQWKNYIFFEFRELNIPLIIANTPGLFAQIFTDFGPKFIVTDETGEEPLTTMIADVTNDKSGGIVTTLDEVRHGFVDGDRVTFSEVAGMVELNGSEHLIEVK